MAEPFDPSIWERIAAVMSAGLLTCAGYIGHVFNGRIKRAEAAIHDIRNKLPSEFERMEINRQRDNIAKLFDLLAEHAKRDEDMHRNIMATMAHNHTEVLMVMSNKADRRR